MDLYRKLKLKPVRSEPDVWFSRVVIYEDTSPRAPKVIRDISLTRGLNIIWAEEPEGDNSTAEITGHSAGKTTFCRFLRFILGEKSFGTKAAMELIRKAFPNGYVAAEIHVGGTQWAVRRPFGVGRLSYAKQDATIEELLQERTGALSQEEYPKKLGLVRLLDDLPTGQIVQTAENIEWQHILAWSTRDQEARFQNVYDWRSPRSESESPSFRFPKAGPLFVMRTVLGLFLPDELKGEERLAELQREKERLTKEIDEKRREPQFRVNLYDLQLRQRLKTVFPNETDIDSRPIRSADLFPQDLEHLTTRAAEQIADAIGQLEGELAELQSQIDDLGAEISQHERELAEMDALFGLETAAATELDQGLSQRQEQRSTLNEHKDKKCPFGGVLVRECSYVLERQRLLRKTELQDTHAMEQAEAKRTEECNRVAEEKNRIRATIEDLQQQRRSARTKRDALRAGIREKRDELRDLQTTRDGLDTWTKRRDAPGGHDDLLEARQKLDAAEAEIGKIEKALAENLRQHDENRKRLAAIFSGAVRSVLLSDSYDGAVTLDNRELAFRITHGPAMSGEAVETLSVLLADVASVVYHTVSDVAHLPGFLVHDSPREADLGIRIYRSFIRFVAALQTHFGQLERCPFQYILTTTTAPPEELRGPAFVKLPLNAATPSGLLLGRNVAVPEVEDATQRLF